MKIIYKETQMRIYLARNRKTGKTSQRRVSNRNNLSVEKHMELLNLNDSEYEYLEYLGEVEHD